MLNVIHFEKIFIVFTTKIAMQALKILEIYYLPLIKCLQFHVCIPIE